MYYTESVDSVSEDCVQRNSHNTERKNARIDDLKILRKPKGSRGCDFCSEYSQKVSHTQMEETCEY